MCCMRYRKRQFMYAPKRYENVAFKLETICNIEIDIKRLQSIDNSSDRHDPLEIKRNVLENNEFFVDTIWWISFIIFTLEDGNRTERELNFIIRSVKIFANFNIF